MSLFGPPTYWKCPGCKTNNLTSANPGTCVNCGYELGD